MPAEDTKGIPEGEPTVLDWFKSLFRGRPIPIPSTERTTGELVVEAEAKLSEAAARGAIMGLRPQPSVGETAKRIESGRPPAVPLLPDLSGLRSSLKAQPWRGAAFVAAWGLWGYVLLRLPHMEPDGSFSGLVIAWVASFILYVVAVASPGKVALPRIRFVRGRSLQIGLALCGVVLVAAVARLWRLGDIPYIINGDEASFGMEAIRILEGEMRDPFSTGHLAQPTMSFFPTSWSISLLGASAAGIRLPSALLGTATVLAAFFLVRRLYGLRLGLMTAIGLATYHYAIHYSRLNLNNIADPLIGALAVLMVYRSLARRDAMSWAITGGVCGLAMYVYTGGRFIPILVGVILVFTWITTGGRQFLYRHGSGLLVLLGAFLLVAGPMLSYAVREPAEFNARINQVGIIQSGWLDREVAIRQEGVPAILLDQFARAFLAFNFYFDRTNFYGMRQPLLDPVFGAIFLIGLGYATIRALTHRSGQKLFPMVAWWWGIIIVGGMMTESPPASQRLVSLAVPVCFFIAFGLFRLVRLASKAVGGLPTSPILAAAVGIFGLMSLKTYFVDFMPQRISGGIRAELAMEAAPLLNELKTDHRIYFVGAPWMFWGFPTLPFLVPDADAEDILEPMVEPPSPAMLEGGKGGVFVILPERINELQVVREGFPEGELFHLYRAADEQFLAAIYIVPPGGG